MKKRVKYSDVDNSSFDEKNGLETENEYCFWESQLYLKLKSCRFFKNNSFKFIDYGFIFYTFFTWVRKWIKLISKEYVEPYKLHPLPISDQILYWQPIFSKHVSDGLIKLDLNESSKSNNTNTKNNDKPYKWILLRATFLTFWKRMILILFGILIFCTCNMSVALIIIQIYNFVTVEMEKFKLIILLVILLSFVQLFIGILLDHINFYMYRLIHIIQYSFSITLFQHGLCYRRKYFNNIGGSNVLNVCNELVHSCSPDSECSKNPLFCPALRYQNKDIDSMIFSFEFMDSYYLSLFIESTVYVIQFVFNFLVGFNFLKYSLSIRIWPLYLFFISACILMITIEIINTIILRYIYSLKDYRINKSREILSGLHLINKMFMDDIAHNIITETRNNELILLLVRFVLSFLNRLLVNISSSFSVITILDDFVNEAFKLNDITKFKTSHMMTGMLVMLRILDSMLFVPDSIKFLTYSLISYFRTEKYTKECSPNFYISDNKYTDTNKMCSDMDVVTKKINKNVVVSYKDASFTWVNNRKDLLNKNYQPYLKNFNFELRRGEIVIVTGAQGSGKSNFVKSVLGEMTLVGGSMAVVPLHTSMPIFYASQDVWLQQGTIRSNITFGYRYDEVLYHKVLKAVELEFDISTWENGDMRTVSDYAHSLSGGQRVRMEAARAIYAYLVFDQVNRKYNNNQCSFLMCLDSTFLSLDPFVSKTVFNNLFNAKSGVLVNDNLSVILAVSTRFFDIVSLTEGSFANITLYQVNDKTLQKVKDLFPNPSLPDTNNLSNVLSVMQTDELIKMCESQEHNREFRGELVKQRYDDSLIVDPETKMKGIKFKESFKPYIIYLKSIGFLFILFIIFTLTYEIIETSKYVVSGELGDDIMETVRAIKSPTEYGSAIIEIRRLCDKALLKIKKLTVFVVIFCFLSNAVLTFTCLRGCKRIHEYCIDSLINNSSTVIRIKKFSSEVLTFLSSDIFMIDENFGPVLSSLIILFIEVLLKSSVLIYYFPLCTPFIFFALFVIVFFVFRHFIHASKNLQIASLESLSRNNFVCEKAVSSSSTYRSFKKESKLLDNVIEYTDYCIRSWFYSKSFLSWASFLSKFAFLFMMLFTFTIPIIYKQKAEVKSFIGYYGLTLMQSVRILFSFTNFVVTIAKLEMLMCSIKRFECFVPPGQKCVFKKSRNTNYEDVVINLESYKGLSTDEVKETLLSRRRKEFKENNQKFYSIRKLGFKPQIDITISDYVLPEHSGVELKDVYVYTSTDQKSDGTILRNINASANKSEIIGIIGRTGAGKTTLLSVLENTIENRTGQVLLDGKDLNDIPKNVTRQVIGVLPQLPFVFKGWTIRRFIDPRRLFNDDEINEALDNCGLLEFVNNLQGGKKLDSVIIPDNLSSSVTSGNVTSLDVDNLGDYYEHCDMLLSNTQLRTLSFARLVLYRNLYRMILVDEPPSENCDTQDVDQNNNTSTTDNKTQPNELGIPIYELLKKYFSHCTTFVTAHDANVLKMCTLVWAMHDGKLIRTCKTSDIIQSGSISNIIEQMVKNV